MKMEEKARILLERAWQAQMRGCIDEACRLYHRSLAIRPTAEAYTFLAWSCSLQGNLEAAIDFCRRAIETDPDLGNSYSDLGSYLIQLERFQEARHWLTKATSARRYTSYYSAQYNMGRVFECLGDEARAIESYRLSLHQCPHCEQSRAAYLNLVSRTN